MRVVLYARVSDEKLKDDKSRRQDIQRQVDKLLAYASIQGWKVAEVYADDGKSAYKDDYQSRPAFSHLLRAIRARWVQRVLVEDLSRWSRRLEEGLRTLREASESGCTVTSTLEGEVDVTAPEAWMRASLSLLFAEWASRTQAEKVKSGMQRRANDKRNVCKSCGVVHLGRHPSSCGCVKCRGKASLRKG